ncbi:major facilitator superfamily domain-containing protein [Xylogone sp. PMI_703]|nr:major facilitator superfamily domain-containing protein [Xylogone sp. PMI_703]
MVFAASEGIKPSQIGPHVNALGSLQLRNADTKEIILIPTPSQDPNDPLNWPKLQRRYLAFLVCCSIFLCTFLAGGPSVAIVQMASSFFGPPGPHLPHQISKIAYFITTVTLMQGIGGLFWMPLILKYGRRPVYFGSFTLYAITTIWAAVATSYANELISRICMGFAIGSAECLAPLVIADIFFVHERGPIMALYMASLTGGVAGGICISGLITIDHGWRTIYYVALALIGSVTLLLFFTMPETAFTRDISPNLNDTQLNEEISEASQCKTVGTQHIETGGDDIPQKHTYMQNLRLFTRLYTEESLLKLFFRPLGLIILPPVFWATLVMSVNIGFLVSITSNFASAFASVYGFEPWQSGLCFISGFLGSLIGIAFGGMFSEKVADIFTKRNRGIREPEMRLPAIVISCLTTPTGLILYGVGVGHKLHWMVPTLGLGLLNFSIVIAVNISFVYTVDSYRPIGGEIMITQLAFKSCFAFLLSFYTNPWIQEMGHVATLGVMAAIDVAVLLFAIPLYFYGKAIRRASLKWKPVKFVQWNRDREVGE